MGDHKGHFISVDVWRPCFGDVSVKAIQEIYRNHHTTSTPEEIKATSLRDMVNYLRNKYPKA